MLCVATVGRKNCVRRWQTMLVERDSNKSSTAEKYKLNKPKQNWQILMMEVLSHFTFTQITLLTGII